MSGLVSAHLLAPHHDITVYEKADRLGGHAHTLLIDEQQNKIAVDNGFMVFNPKQYPHFVSLLRELGVSSRQTTMSFGVHIPGQISYRGEIPFGLFADKSNLLNVRFYKFLKQIVAFRKAAKKALKDQNNTSKTLGEFLSDHNFSSDLANWFLYPMLAAIWSIQESAIVEDFPAFSTFVFLNNHKLLDNMSPKWRTVNGGSIEYVSRIHAAIKKHGATIMLNATITNIKRSEKSVAITSDGSTQQYDYVIVATHADTAMQLLSDISAQEKLALQKFSYTTSKTIVHKDTKVVPSNGRLLASWNYSQTTPAGSKPITTFTYCMNILQHIPKDTPVYVTLNPLIQIDKDKIYAEEQYTHPQYNNASLQGQREIADLQGTNRTIFVGAHLGYGFHEDGVQSAINAAKLLGITPSWLTKI